LDQLIRTKLLEITIFAGHFNISDPTVQIIKEMPTNAIVHENFIVNILEESLIYKDMALIKVMHIIYIWHINYQF